MDLKSNLKLNLELEPLFSSRILVRPSLQRLRVFHMFASLADLHCFGVILNCVYFFLRAHAISELSANT